MHLKEPNLNPIQKAKTRGLLSVLHMIAGNSVIVKTIIVSVALVAGYSSVLYFKGDNAISQTAEEIIVEETGVPIHFSDTKPNNKASSQIQAS